MKNQSHKYRYFSFSFVRFKRETAIAKNFDQGTLRSVWRKHQTLAPNGDWTFRCNVRIYAETRHSQKKRTRRTEKHPLADFQAQYDAKKQKAAADEESSEYSEGELQPVHFYLAPEPLKQNQPHALISHSEDCHALFWSSFRPFSQQKNVWLVG